MGTPAKRMSGRNRSARGFTLMEMLVALAILALLAAVTVPALASAIDRERFKACAREIADALKTARYAALSTQTESVLSLDVEAKTYRLDGGNERRLAAPRDLSIEVLTATSERRSASSGTIRFFADGSSTGGTVTMVRGDRRRVVAVDWLTGRVEVRIP